LGRNRKIGTALIRFARGGEEALRVRGARGDTEADGTVEGDVEEMIDAWTEEILAIGFGLAALIALLLYLVGRKKTK